MFIVFNFAYSSQKITKTFSQKRGHVVRMFQSYPSLIYHICYTHTEHIIRYTIRPTSTMVVELLFVYIHQPVRPTFSSEK